MLSDQNIWYICRHIILPCGKLKEMEHNWSMRAGRCVFSCYIMYTMVLKDDHGHLRQKRHKLHWCTQVLQMRQCVITFFFFSFFFLLYILIPWAHANAILWARNMNGIFLLLSSTRFHVIIVQFRVSLFQLGKIFAGYKSLNISIVKYLILIIMIVDGILNYRKLRGFFNWREILKFELTGV